MLDLVNPVGAGRGLVGGGWEAGFDKRSTRHAAYLGGGGKESNLQERNTARRIGEMPRPLVPSYPSAEDKPRWPPLAGFSLSGAGQENDGVLGFSGQVIQTGLYSP